MGKSENEKFQEGLVLKAAPTLLEIVPSEVLPGSHNENQRKISSWFK